MRDIQKEQRQAHAAKREAEAKFEREKLEMTEKLSSKTAKQQGKSVKPMKEFSMKSAKLMRRIRDKERIERKQQDIACEKIDGKHDQLPCDMERAKIVLEQKELVRKKFNHNTIMN